MSKKFISIKFISSAAEVRNDAAFYWQTDALSTWLNLVYCGILSVVDPAPHGSARIRTDFGGQDPDPGRQKWSTKIEKREEIHVL